MFDDDFLYEPNDIESEEFISEAPVNLLKENIKAQFEDPLEYRKKDYITSFITMYRYSRDNADAYEDEDRESVIELRDNFYIFMQDMFRDYLGLGFVDLSDMSSNDQDDVIHYVYRFFLINIRRNFVTLVLNYIEKNRDQYEVEDPEARHDVTSLSFKKEITDPVDIYILSNLHTVVEDILAQDIDVDDFFDNCDSEDTLETRYVKQLFEDCKVTGNFVESYIEMLDASFISTIETKVRNKILKKYKKK